MEARHDAEQVHRDAIGLRQVSRFVQTKMLHLVEACYHRPSG
jgi:hypothetical protein